MSSVSHGTGFPPADPAAEPLPPSGIFATPSEPSAAVRDSGFRHDETRTAAGRSLLGSSPVRARRAARHRTQADTAADRARRLVQLELAQDDRQGAVEAPAEAQQRAAAYEAFRARLRAAKSSRARGAAHATAARETAVSGPASPSPAAPADTTFANTGGAPGKGKNSVSAGTSEAPRDLGVRRDIGKLYEQRNNKSQARMRMLDEARDVTTLTGTRRCGAMPLGGAVSVTQKGDGSGGFAGLFRCGSVWSCPECSPVVRADRAVNLETWAAAWMKAGHGMAMATFTVRHWEHARLAPQLEGIAGAWRKLQQGRWWGDFRAKYGVVGVTRAIEVTHSWRNSWHGHIHAALWTEEPVDADTARVMETALYERWAKLVKRAKLGTPTRKHGVRVDPARRGEAGARDLAKYLVKIQDKDNEKAPEKSLGNELLRGDNKVGRHASRTPFEILRSALAGDERDLELWREYEQATKGHRMLTWGGDIRARLKELVDVQELEAAATVQADDTRNTKAVLVQVEPTPWRGTVAAVPGRRGQLRVAVKVASDRAMQAGLDDTETPARAAVVELLESWGMRPGVDFYGPDDERFDASLNPDTGEVAAAPVPSAGPLDSSSPPEACPVVHAPLGPITPAPPRERRPRLRWQTVDELDATTHILGIRPQDSARPQLAARRAAGLPVARDITADPAAVTERTDTRPCCAGCGRPLGDFVVDGRHYGCVPEVARRWAQTAAQEARTDAARTAHA